MPQSKKTALPAILVVDDEVIVRMDLADTFRDAGFETFEAGSADEAIHLMENHPGIRLLFTDVDMPGSMDGLKLAHYVRDRWPPVRIIVGSGHTQTKESDLPVRSSFMPKPYQSAELDRLVRSL